MSGKQESSDSGFAGLMLGLFLGAMLVFVVTLHGEIGDAKTEAYLLEQRVERIEDAVEHNAALIERRLGGLGR